MRRLFVIMLDELFDQVVQVRRTQDDEVIQAFDLDRLNPALREGIEVG